MTDIAIHPDYLRQQGFFDPAENANAACTFIGVGGIGSFASFAIAKLGVPHITLIDPDHVEPHNLPSQMFDGTQAFDSKVEAAASNIRILNPDLDLDWYQASIEDDGWSEDVRLRGIVISGLDSMRARSNLWHQALKMNVSCPLYIDGRLDGQTIVIYALKPWDLHDVENYEKQALFHDDDALTGLCTERAIIDVGFTIAAQITRLVRRHYAGQSVPNITVINMDTNVVRHGGWLPL